jgi:hypothetical protein
MPRSRARSLAALVTPMLLLGSGLAPTPARADEPLFGYIYTTDLLPQGRWEVEQWATARLQKSRGDYTQIFFREELEYGVTDNFQLAGYFDWFYVAAERNNVDGTTGGPHVPENVDPNRGYKNAKFHDIAVEGIWRLLSPYKDGVGLALYLEPAIGQQEYELEYRVIVQKNFFDDRLVWATNLQVEHEWERQPGNPLADPADPEFRRRWERETAVELTTGLSYRFASNWFAGIEFRNHNEFDGIGFSKPGHSAFFLGPNLHFATERFWATLTVLPQLPLAQAYSQDQKDVKVGARIFGDEHEKVEIRFKAGIVF